MKLKPIIGILGSVLFINSAVAGPSAKFAATWNTDFPNLVSMAQVVDATADTFIFDYKIGYTLTTIKVPQDKELLVGVSAEVALFTDTSVKGKNGGSAKAMAGAAGGVLIVAVPVREGAPSVAAPGPVVLSARVQVLEATLGGVIESCTDDDLDGTITVADDCIVSDEEIGLMLATMASHHFNFVLPNMDAGEYAIKAIFGTAALAAVDIDETTQIFEGDDQISNISASATGIAAIGKTMVTVQQVRAVKDSLGDVDIVE